MRVFILSIKNINSLVVVKFKSSIGIGLASWNFNSNPLINKFYDVEFSIKKTLETMLDLTKNKNFDYQIEFFETTVTMNGVIEGFELDGSIYFRLGDDCLMNIKSEAVKVQEGEWVKLKLNCLDLLMYPF